MKHKISICEVDLPERFRDALRDMRSGKRRGTIAPNERRIRTISMALRGLIEASRAAGLPDDLTPASVAAFEAALRTRAVTQGAIAALMTELRFFARYSGIGLAWAKSTKKDVRSVADVLAGRHWRPFRARAESLVLEGVRASDLKLLDRWLRSRPRCATDAHVRTFVQGSLRTAQTLARLMFALEPDGADQQLFDLERVRLGRSKTGASKVSGEGRGRRATLSVPADQLPPSCHAVLSAMKSHASGSRPATIRGLEIVLRQYVFFVRKNNFQDLWHVDTFGAFFDELDCRDLKERTKGGYARRLASFTKRAGFAPDLTRLLHEEADHYLEQALPPQTAKRARLAAVPLTLVDIAAGARRSLESARAAQSAHARRSTYMLSTALALLSVFAYRAADLTSLVIGVSVRRSTDGWSVAFELSKTGEPHFAKVNDALTEYLDAAILLGATRADFWQLYERLVVKPLLRSSADETYSYAWLRRNLVEATGHPPHSVRTLLQDAAADLGAVGAEVAKTLFGHRDPRSARHYEVEAPVIYAATAQKALARLSTGEDDE